MENTITIENEITEIRDATVALGNKASKITAKVLRNKKLYSGKELEAKQAAATHEMSEAVSAYTEVLEENASVVVAGLRAEIEVAASNGNKEILNAAVDSAKSVSEILEKVLEGLRSLEKFCKVNDAIIATEEFRDRLKFAGEQAQDHLKETATATA